VQFITRQTNLSCGHRVMNERMLCYNLHGHEYITHLTFSFEQLEDIGYAIDFKEIKRVFIQYLQDSMDHGMLLNAHDKDVVDLVNKIGTKLWLMSLNGEGKYCNPSVENIAKEVFLAMEILSKTLYGHARTGLRIHDVTIYETPNCWTKCITDSITGAERLNFERARGKQIIQYAEAKGIIEYDDRKLN
jgi:6-pyruvoyltetrahydropterin/6-carboxytetrahydropterin synthase